VASGVKESEMPYPGSETTHGQMLALAIEYRRIALSLDKLLAEQRPLVIAPYRFAAIHSIELYFNAYLLFKGFSHIELRRSQHDLKHRQLLAHTNGLVLKKKTILMLEQLMMKREYLTARYSISGSKHSLDFPSLERILNELAQKVTYRICNSKEKPRSVS
jgi:hypothetical protein